MTEERADRLPPEVAAALDQLDGLIQMFAEHPDEDVQHAVVEMLRAVDLLHRQALQRLATLLDARSLLDDAVADPHVALLFGLYGTEHGPSDDERTRVEAVVAKIRPEIEAYGGRLEVVKAEGGVVNIRLGGISGDPSASTEKLRGLVEGFLRAELPEFVRMDLSSPGGKAQSPWEPTPVVIPLSRLTRRSRVPGAGGSSGHRRSSSG